MEPNEGFKQELTASLPDLLRFAQVKTRDRNVAPDLVQDTVIQALKSWQNYQPGSNMIAWLFTIMENTRLNERRKLQSRLRKFESFALDIKSDQASCEVRSDSFSRVLLRQTGELMESLPIDQKAALYLVGVEEYTYEEAAKMLEISVGTVKSRVSRARERLNQALNENLERGRSTAPKF